MTERSPAAPLASDLASALSAWAAGVTLVTIADDRDDIGTTVSAFCPVSLDPPLVLVSLMAESYPAEVLSRPSLPALRTRLVGRGTDDPEEVERRLLAAAPGAAALLERLEQLGGPLGEVVLDSLPISIYGGG